MKFREQLHPSWRDLLADQLSLLDEIEAKVSRDAFLPRQDFVMRALSYDFSKSKVLILGQDPYPNPKYPVGLAFSIPAGEPNLPASLKNIFKELNSDLGISSPKDGDLSPWVDQGVVLLNRTLTCRSGASNSHFESGWWQITENCVQALANSGVVAILWGKNAQECSKYFSEKKSISSPHPSPLSAHRGFFGSRPFSRANVALAESGNSPIDWTL